MFACCNVVEISSGHPHPTPTPPHPNPHPTPSHSCSSSDPSTCSGRLPGRIGGENSGLDSSPVQTSVSPNGGTPKMVGFILASLENQPRKGTLQTPNKWEMRMDLFKHVMSRYVRIHIHAYTNICVRNLTSIHFACVYEYTHRYAH